jgi:hypothetical protein
VNWLTVGGLVNEITELFPMQADIDAMTGGRD